MKTSHVSNEIKPAFDANIDKILIERILWKKFGSARSNGTSLKTKNNNKLFKNY